VRDIVAELKVERKELKVKFEKLDQALTDYKSLRISQNQMNLMSDQWVAMKHYIGALDNRIKDLEK